MNATIKQSLHLQGCITAPSSKSSSIRAVIFALLANGKSSLFNMLTADDTRVALEVCKALGADIHQNKRTVSVNSSGLPLLPRLTEIHTGNSGITTTFTLPMLGLRANNNAPIIINCGEQMRLRPMLPLIKALRQLGMHITYQLNEEQFPLLVTGELSGGKIEIDGENSQYVSALLISLPCAKNNSIITVKNLCERPYVEMTLSYLQAHSIVYQHERHADTDIFYIQGKQRYIPTQTTMKGDYSSAASFIAAAVLIPSNVTIQGLDQHDHQGDKRLISILKKMGAAITVNQQSINIKGKQSLKGIRIDASDIPDLVPTLAVIATQAYGKTEITNVAHARFKETNRLHSMTQGLQAMGAKITEQADGLTIEKSTLKGTFVEGCQDHRTVMGLTIAGLLAEGETHISNSEAINKTYPEFFNALKTLGAHINLEKKISEKHIILIGFKYVGKSIIGRRLASSLNKNFIDLDSELENYYQENFSDSLNCREIMEKHGEKIYRNLEYIVLQRTLTTRPSIISLGGGTATQVKNQHLIKLHTLLHVTAPRGIVFERIMIDGRPAFFNKTQEPYESFCDLYTQREKIYQSLTNYVVSNDKTIEEAVDNALEQLKIIKRGQTCLI